VTRADDTAVPPYLERLTLDGKGAVVLGAGQGIGRQVAHALTQALARVYCVDIDDERTQDIVLEIGGCGGSGDITRRDEVERLFADAEEKLGKVDVIVDIVGMSRYASLVDISDADWDWEFDIVLRHAYLVAQIGGTLLARSGGGAIAYVSSVSGLSGAPSHAAYGAMKAALMSLVRSAAVELGPAGIRVNAVAPGAVWTPRMSEFLGETARQSIARNTPLGRVALPEDIAAALLFMVSDLSTYISGQTLVVDGGTTAKMTFPTDSADNAAAEAGSGGQL
jgi:NAD(P)-dependent dehydrogenase (short-subunit alcohol dehydrogenase family)